MLTDVVHIYFLPWLEPFNSQRSIHHQYLIQSICLQVLDITYRNNLTVFPFAMKKTFTGSHAQTLRNNELMALVWAFILRPSRQSETILDYPINPSRSLQNILVVQFRKADKFAYCIPRDLWGSPTLLRMAAASAGCALCRDDKTLDQPVLLLSDCHLCRSKVDPPHSTVSFNDTWHIWQ